MALRRQTLRIDVCLSQLLGDLDGTPVQRKAKGVLHATKLGKDSLQRAGAQRGGCGADPRRAAHAGVVSVARDMGVPVAGA